MIALMFAAALSAAPAERPMLQPGTVREIPTACRVQATPVRRAEPPARVTRLADLPKAHLMLPVVRSVEGCAVPTIVRYDVEGDGRFANPAR